MRKRKWFRETGSDVTDGLPCKQLENGVGWSCNLASRYKNVFHGIKYGDCTATTKCYSHSVRFSATELFVCRLEKHERALSVLTEESYAQEITLIGYLTIHQLLQWNPERATMSLRGNCRRIGEVYMDWFEDSATQSIITITSNGEVGRPWFHMLSFQMFSGNYKPWSSNFPVPC